MKRIQEHIKNQTFARAYLIYGDEEYLMRTYKNRLKQAIVGDDDMNYAYYEGRGYNVSDVRDASETLPFFADRRLILMENTGAFKNASEELVEIVKNAPESTYYIFVETEVDKRNKLFKLIGEIGYVSEMKTPSADDMATWLARMFSEAGKKITRNDMVLLLDRAGQETDMDHLRNEAAKLISYVGDRDVITAEDINTICITQTVDRVFDMVNALAMKDSETAIRLYSDLVTLKEPPMKILTLVGRQFAQLLGVKELLEQGLGNQQIAEKLGIRPYFVGRYISQARAFKMAELREAVEDCVEAENAVKTGMREDTYAVELVILKYCKSH